MTERDIKRALGKRVRLTDPKLHIAGAEYILSGAVIRRGERGFYYQAELTDVKCGHSLVYAPLENIERSEGACRQY